MTLQSGNFHFSFDSGGMILDGDILFAGNSAAATISPFDGALFDDGHIGAGNYNNLTQANVSAAAFASNPILPAALTVGEVFFVHTLGGHYAKAMVIATSPGSVTLEYTTFGVPGAPVIADVQNNASLLPAGYLAPSSLIVIHGTALANAGATPATLWNVSQTPLPLTLNGASVSVTVNGTTVQPALYYASPTQIDAVLPAATPVGYGTLTVTVNGTASAPRAIQVVPSALGFDTYNNTWGIATDGSTYALLTPTSSGSPGETIILWGTGLGADPNDSDTAYTATPHSVNVPLQIYIGGVPATILYQGASSYPGTNQINVVIPATAPTGCYVPVAGVAGGIVSNTATLPIAAGGGGCSDPAFHITGTQLSTLSGKATVNLGQLNLSQLSLPGTGGASRINASAYLLEFSGVQSSSTSGSLGGQASLGTCSLNQTVTGNSNGATSAGLLAGTITLTGSSGSAIPLASPTAGSGLYVAPLPLSNGTIPTLPPAGTLQGSGAPQLAADVVGTVTLNAGMALSLDTGATSPFCNTNCAGAGGDIEFVYPGPFATAANIYAANAYVFSEGIQTSAAVYNNTTAATAAALAPAIVEGFIPPSALAVGDVFLVHSSGGNFAKLMITAVSAGSITLAYHTFATAGTQVGPFTAAVSLPNPALSWTNQSAASSIARSSGLQVNWTGGAASSFVTILGSASAAGLTGSFTCNAPASAGQFTVPSYILLGLPAGAGSTTVENSTNYTGFTASGLDSGVAFGVATAGSVNSIYQ